MRGCRLRDTVSWGTNVQPPHPTQRLSRCRPPSHWRRLQRPPAGHAPAVHAPRPSCHSRVKVQLHHMAIQAEAPGPSPSWVTGWRLRWGLCWGWAGCAWGVGGGGGAGLGAGLTRAIGGASCRCPADARDEWRAQPALPLTDDATAALGLSLTAVLCAV